MSDDDLIDWQDVSYAVEVVLREYSAPNRTVTPSNYVVELLPDGLASAHWNSIFNQHHSWPETINEVEMEASRIQSEIADSQWIMVAISADGEVIWRRALPDSIPSRYHEPLRKAWLTTTEDIRRCDDLTAIDGIGEVGAAQIREAIE